MSSWSSPPLASGRVAILALAALAPTSALAENPTCASISGGAPIVYGAGGSAQASLVLKSAAVLQTATSPVFVVYKSDAGACSGINALTGLGPTSITGTAAYWDLGTNAQATCTLPVGGEAVDFGVMGNGPELCPLVTDPSYVADITTKTGPISSVNAFVPKASTQQAISAEAFYLIYGFGAAAGVAPWTNPDPAYYVHRNENSFVQIYLAKATGLPVTKFHGVDAGTNANSVAYVAALAEPEQGIGFASGDVADANRATVRTLAWKGVGQTKAYWPDSDATSFDKINVRKGAYELWSPVHLYATKGATAGSIADAGVAALFDYIAGVSQPAGTTKTITEVAIGNKNIPVCAMEVARDGDLGAPITAWSPPEPCGCFFDFKATGATSCQSCSDASPCSGTDVCRHGYCEAY